MKRRVFFILTLLYVLAGVRLVRGQGTVHGYISDAGSGETLLMANITVAGLSQGTASNNAGYYILSGLQPGSYELVVSYIGYETRRIGVSVVADGTIRVDVKLTQASVLTEEVVVTAARAEEAERTRLGVDRVPVHLVTEVPALFEADVFRALQLLPGISSSSDFSSGLLIRGGGADQTLILLDQAPVYNPTHFFGLFSTFNPDAIKDVQVYKGTYPLRYGGRLSSVVDVYNKDGNRERMQGTATVGILASRAAVEGPWRHGAWMVAGRRSTLEPLLAAMRASNDGIPERFFFYDMNGRFTLDAGADDRLSLALYGGRDMLRFSPVDAFSMDLPYGNRTVH